jgi:hypothetical protein
MSVEQMIAEHPNAGSGPVEEALSRSARHAMLCAAICNSCADACSGEAMDMSQCVRTCLDCSDVCQATSRLAMRRTGANEGVLRAQLGACIDACDACAAECARHDDDHCQRCARMCAECAEDCRLALAELERRSSTIAPT